MKHATGTIALLAALPLLAACGQGGKSFDLPPEVEAAMGTAADLHATFPLITVSGLPIQQWDAIGDLFPEAQALVDGVLDTQAALEAAFDGTPAYDRDLELAIYAWALHRRGDPSSVGPLASFVKRNVDGDVHLSLFAAAWAARSLFESMWTEGDDTMWYSPEELRLVGSLAARVSSAVLYQPMSLDDPRDRCTRRMRLLDANGTPLAFQDGTPGSVTIDGILYRNNTVPKPLVDDYNAKVPNLGGTYVNVPGLPDFPGAPTKTFNCGGFVSRHFNGGKPWVACPEEVRSRLLRSGAIVEINAADSEPGDLIFYFKDGEKIASHAAEQIDSSGFTFKRVRNGDQVSGLFEAAMNAPYFLGGYGKDGKDIAGTYADFKVYRWTAGIPGAEPDPAFATDAGNCENVPKPDPCANGGCDGDKPSGHVWVGGISSGGGMVSGLAKVDAGSGKYEGVRYMAIDGIAISPDGTRLATGMMGGGEGHPGMEILDLSDDANRNVRTVFTFLPWQDSAQQIDHPAWLPDSDDLLMVRVGDLHVYDVGGARGSMKVGAGYRPTCSPLRRECIFESSSGAGLKFLPDPDASGYLGFDPWDIREDNCFGSEDPEKTWIVTGSTGAWEKAKWHPRDGDRLLVLDDDANTSIRIVRLSSDRRSASVESTIAAGGRVVSAAWTRDGNWIAYAVMAKKDVGGGLWAVKADGTGTIRLRGEDLSGVLYIDMACSD